MSVWSPGVGIPSSSSSASISVLERFLDFFFEVLSDWRYIGVGLESKMEDGFDFVLG